MSATLSAEQTRTCSRCGRTLPLADLVKKPRSAAGAAPMCLACDRQRRNREPLGWREVADAPDRRAPVRLRQLLRLDRRYALPFGEIWSENIAIAIEGLAADEQAEWRHVFAQQEPIWRDAYYRRPAGQTPLSIDLIDAA